MRIKKVTSERGVGDHAVSEFVDVSSTPSNRKDIELENNSLSGSLLPLVMFQIK